MAENNPLTELYRRQEAVRQKAALDSIAKNLDEINFRQRHEQLARENQEAETQQQERNARERLAKSACESLRKAIALDARTKITIAETVIEQPNEALLLGTVSAIHKHHKSKAAKIDDKIDMFHHLLGSCDGQMFKSSEDSFWDIATLIHDRKYYCVIRTNSRPADYIILDKVESKRDDLGEFLQIASRLPISEASKKSCDHLLSLWNARNKERATELQEIVSGLPRIKSDFHKRRSIKLAIIAVGILALWLGPSLVASLRGTALVHQEDTSSPRTVLENIVTASKANDPEKLMSYINAEHFRPPNTSDVNWENIRKEIGLGIVKDKEMLSNYEKILNATNVIEVKVDNDKKKLVTGKSEMIFMKSDGKWQLVF